MAWDKYYSFDIKSDFQSAVDELELSTFLFTHLSVETLDFIRRFGTHVVEKARMGAVCEESVYVKSSKSGSSYTDFYTHTQNNKRELELVLDEQHIAAAERSVRR